MVGGMLGGGGLGYEGLTGYSPPLFQLEWERGSLPPPSRLKLSGKIPHAQVQAKENLWGEA